MKLPHYPAVGFSQILSLVFAGLFVYSAIAVGGKIRHEDGWAIADWLIHYQDGGFKRRGLLGTAFVFLGKSLPIKTVLMVFFGLLYAAFYFLLYRLSRQWVYAKNIWFLLLLPAVLLYPVFEKAVVGRKEILLLLFFLWACSRNLGRSKTGTWWMLPVYFVLILVHELSFFFLPYLCFLLYTASENKKKALAEITILVLGSCGLMALLLQYGHPINAGQSLQNLERIGYVIRCEGSLNDCSIFSWVQQEAFMARFQNGWGAMAAYVFSYGAHLWMLSFFMLKQYRRTFFWVALTGTIFSIPLFYLGIDWGRWVNVHLCLLVFLLLRHPEGVDPAVKKPWLYALLFVLSCLMLVGHSSDGFLLSY